MTTIIPLEHTRKLSYLGEGTGRLRRPQSQSPHAELT